MIARACVKCGRPSEDGYCSKHRRKAWETSRRKERMGLSGGAWATVRRKVLKRDRGCCYLCDQLGADTVDHLLDVALGGTSRMDNLASAHADCHARRHREPEWAQPRIEMALAALSTIPNDADTRQHRSRDGRSGPQGDRHASPEGVREGDGRGASGAPRPSRGLLGRGADAHRVQADLAPHPPVGTAPGSPPSESPVGGVGHVGSSGPSGGV